MNKRPTIADVAKAAGVSTGTVSNFLNETRPIKPATAERIENAIRSLTYRPSAFARALPLRAARHVEKSDDLPRLLVVGHICVDYLCRIPVLPHRDDRVSADVIEKAMGGPGANLAVAAAGLGEPYGLNVNLATAAGDDADSEWALNCLNRCGVDTIPLRKPKANRLPKAMVMIEANGSRTIVAETFELTEIDLSGKIDIEAPEHPSCLHIEGFQYENMRSSIDMFREAGWRISLHGAGLPAKARTPEAFARLLERIDMTFVNDETVRAIFSINAPLAAMIDEFARVLSRIKQRGDVVLTLGPFGAVVFPRKAMSYIEVPALAVEPIDVTGAGDAFAGIFLNLWLHGETLDQAARYATIGASLSTMAVGAQARVSSASEIQALLPSLSLKPTRAVS